VQEENKKIDKTTTIDNKNHVENTAARSSKNIWDYVKLPKLSDTSPKEMFRSNKLRFQNTKITGASAETRVEMQIIDNIGWAVTKEATQGSIIDLFAISVQPPYKIAVIQVKSAYKGSRTIHVDAKHLDFNVGPVWVIVAEIKPREYSYLIFSHAEFKKYVTENARYYGIEQGYKNPEWDFSVPTKLEHTRFESFLCQWSKIEKNAKLYVK